MIEMSKKYQTRDGRAVRILAIDTDSSFGSYPVIGKINDGGREALTSWTKEGKQFLSDEEGLLDLIPAPTKHEGWVYLYDVMMGPMPEGGKPKIPVTWES